MEEQRVKIRQEPRAITRVKQVFAISFALTLYTAGIVYTIVSATLIYAYTVKTVAFLLTGSFTVGGHIEAGSDLFIGMWDALIAIALTVIMAGVQLLYRLVTRQRKIANEILAAKERSVIYEISSTEDTAVSIDKIEL